MDIWSWPVVNTVFLLVLTYILYKLTQAYFHFKQWKKLYECFPQEHEHYHWLKGHAYRYPGPNEEGLKFQMDRVAMFPKMNLLWFGFFRPVLIFHHPDTVKIILKTSEPKPRSKGSVYLFGLKWLGEGLLIANGEKWARSRRLLTPAFHFNILQPYVNVYNKAVDIFLEKVEKSHKAGTSFELFFNVGLTSLDIILQCAFSYHSDCQLKGERHPYVLAVEELSNLWVERSLKLHLYIDWIYFLTRRGKKFLHHCNYVHQVAEEIIEKRKKTLEAEGPPTKRYLDFLDILLTAKDDTGQGMTSLEIRDEVDTFLFEGHDTTTSAMCWTLYSLAGHPEFQKKVQAEVDGVLSGRESDDITWEDLQKLDYLTLCIKEGMRLHTPVTFIQRQTTKEIEVEGLKIPPNTCVGVQLYNLHHNPVVWDEPYEFRPERFLTENIDQRDNYAFVPFSAGPRNCIGQNFAMNEQKVLLAKLLHRYTLELDPAHDVKKKIGVVMRAEHGIKVFATARDGHNLISS